VNNMRKHTTEYKLKRLAIIASACVIGVTAGLCGVYGYKGAKEKKLNKFEKEYNNTISISADNSPDEVIDKAIDMLNNEQYSDYFDKYEDKEGNLLYQIALSYYSKKEYDSANEYFEDALLCIDESDIYRDYAVSLAKSGNLTKAQMIVDDNSEKIDEMDIRQIRAEINFEESNYSEAIDDFIYVLNNSSDKDLRIRTTVLLCEAYYEMGNYEEMEELLLTDTMSEDYTASKNRLLSIAYIGMANKSEGVERSRYYGMAEECLKYLEEINCLNYEEELNLVIVYQNTGKFNMASDKLSDMMSKYPEDYRIYVQKCFLIYNEQASYDAEKRNYSEFDNYYIRTINLYNSQNTSGIDNEKIIQLKNLYQELKNLGYL
ncbi:MAG: hypothetical protein IJ167_05280, partial [Lachnospiraceae bacterium]|nr:hypothetical protein [Lachnospiraceae bacterium]